MGPALLLRATELMISVGVAVQALEMLAARHLFSPTGLYNWDILMTNIEWAQVRGIRTVLASLLQYPQFLGLVLTQLAAALVLLSGWLPEWASVSVGIMLAVHMLFLLRNQYGLDGSDQMMLLVLAALFAYHLYPTALMLTIAFGFLTAQLFLSYLTAGIAKIISPVWRCGDAIVGILNTESHGSRFIAGFVLGHRWAAVAACWGVIGYECCGPLVALINPHVTLGFIVVGTALHLAIGVCMGLNLFFWSFTATYPALYYIAQRIS